MRISHPFDLYHACLVVAPVGWKPAKFAEGSQERGFDVSGGPATFFVPHADDTILVTTSTASEHELPSTDVLRAVRVPFQIDGSIMLSNVDIEDDLPLPEIPRGRYCLQFELHPATVRDGVSYAYDVRLVFVRDDGAAARILVSDHLRMTAPVGPV